MTDHEILIQIQEDIKWIKESLSNHLHSHTRYSIVGWIVVTGLTTALLVAMLK